MTVAKTGAKAAQSAMKGVLGFGKKMKGHKMQEVDSSTAGLMVDHDDLDDSDNANQWNMLDEDEPEFQLDMVAEH